DRQDRAVGQDRRWQDLHLQGAGRGARPDRRTRPEGPVVSVGMPLVEAAAAPLGAAAFALLWLIVIAVLILPFTVAAVERNLEVFLLALGAAAVTVSGAWGGALVEEALREPVRITLAVLGAGLAFHYGRRRLDRAIALARRH